MGAPSARAVRGVIVMLAVLLVTVGALVLLHSGGPLRPAPPAATPPLPRTPAPGPDVAWLGLNYNSGAGVGTLQDFARRGIVYDREGGISVKAGATPASSARFAHGLAVSFAAGMVPDIQVNPALGPRGCTHDPVPPQLCLPTAGSDIAAFVDGFVKTANSVIHAYPRHRALFEPMDEPWDWAFPPGTSSGKTAASQYALIVAEVLRAAAAAGIPLRDIYVPATGVLNDGTWWIPDLYAAQPCLKPGRASCGPIEAWNLHPYGRPHSATEGIDYVPRVRADMLSGQNNLVVSEIGFCALDVNSGKSCQYNQPDVDGTSAQAATWLRQTLVEAARMHEQGWLRALLIWERAATGWAMQNRDGSLTAQGRVLDLFADSPAGR